MTTHAGSDDLAIDLRNVTVAFGDRMAVDDLTLTAGRGEILGLLGPNGAGKTTTVDVSVGLRTPDSGSVYVLGVDVVASTKQIRGQIGMVAQESGLYGELNSLEHLTLTAALYGLRRPKARIEEVLRLMGLWERRRGRVSSFSGGMRRRLALARALLHDPAVLFLDEPTLGVDVQGRRALWDHTRRMRDEGRTVLLTTNYLEEATALCDRVAILDHGRVVACGPPSHLRRQLGATVVLDCGAENDEVALKIAKCPGVERVDRLGDEIRVKVGEDSAAAGVVAFAAAIAPVRAMWTEEPSLEDAFIQLTGSALRE